MTDDPRDGAAGETPRPHYGEYATPEEQRARIAQPDVTDALSAGVAPAPIVAPPQSRPANAASTAAPGAHQGYGGDLPGVQRPPRSAVPADRFVTLLLLGLGALNVVISIGGFLDLAESLTRTMSAMGVPGEFTNVAAAETWGVVATVALVAGYLFTAFLAWRRMRAGRLSWWIPIVGAVVTYAIVVGCLTVPLSGDPAFQEYVGSVS